MPSLALDDRFIYFAHCPKAGGTSIETFMVERWGDRVGMLGWGWDRLWFSRRAVRTGGIPCSPQHYTWQDARVRLRAEPDVAFALVRDPVARMVSEYRYQRTERRSGRLWPLIGRLDFSTWLQLMSAVHALNPYAFDNHFRPQVEFVPDGAAVFHLEDGLGKVGAWLCAQAGEPPPPAMPHDLKAPLAGARIVPSRVDLDLILRWFEADYRRFGYRPPDLAAAPQTAGGDRRWAFARAMAPLVNGLYRRGLV
ncbi:MAG: sulfotransferase family protein [Rhodobacteraceae bacterium]|jgi:hypothetical protein|nr:sulfotransferase family protein [Paracoccaceae bacterium]